MCERWLLLVLPLAAAGCADPCDAVISEVGDAAHSAQLVWHGSAASVSLSYEATGDPDPRTAEVTSDGVTHSAELWGLPPHSAVSYQLTDDQSGQRCEDSFTTAGTEAGLPSLDVTLNYSDRTDGSWAYIAGVAMGKPGTLFVLDRRGQLRWHEVHDEAINVSTVEVADGQLHHNAFDPSRATDIGTIVSRPLVGGEAVSVRTEGSHHSFTRLPDGTLAYLAVDVRAVLDPDTGEDVDVVGDQLVELGPDGSARVLWSVWDHEEPDLAQLRISDFYGDLGKDWSHANGVFYSAERDSYLISLGHLDVVYELDRPTGAPVRRLAAADVVDGHRFHFQHDPRWTADGTLTMISYPPDGGAVAVEYAVSGGGRLSEVWSYWRDSGGITLLGQVRRLAGGNTFINYGGMGEIREVTPGGDVVWQLNAGIGSWFGNVDLLERL